MRTGVSSWTYTWNVGVSGYERPVLPFGWRELLDEAIRLKASVLQIADNLSLECAENLDELACQAAGAGVELETGTRGIRPEKLMQFIDLSKRLGVRIVRTLLHDGADVPDMSSAYDQIREVIPELEKRNMILAIENHDLYPALQLRALIERLGSCRVQICLDTVNNFAQGEGTKEVLEALGAYTVCFHCKDFQIRRIPTGMGFELQGCPLGRGMLDVKSCIPQLRHNADMSFVVELWTPWQGDITRTCAWERRWAEESMNYLNKLRKEIE